MNSWPDFTATTNMRIPFVAGLVRKRVVARQEAGDDAGSAQPLEVAQLETP